MNDVIPVLQGLHLIHQDKTQEEGRYDGLVFPMVGFLNKKGEQQCEKGQIFNHHPGRETPSVVPVPPTG